MSARSNSVSLTGVIITTGAEGTVLCPTIDNGTLSAFDCDDKSPQTVSRQPSAAEE